MNHYNCVHKPNARNIDFNIDTASSFWEYVEEKRLFLCMLCYALKHRNINSSKCSCSHSYDRTILHHCVDSPFDGYTFAPISKSVHPLAPGVGHFKPWTEGETRMGIPGFNPLAEMGRRQSNTFPSIPYRIHIQLIEIFTKTFTRAAISKNVDDVTTLLLLPSLLLWKPRDHGKGIFAKCDQAANTAKIIEERIRQLADPVQCWNLLAELLGVKLRSEATPTPLSTRETVAIAEDLFHLGLTGRANAALTRSKPAPATTENLRLLQDLHPEADTRTRLPNHYNQPDVVEVSPDEVEAAIKSFEARSSTGLSGLSSDLLQYWVFRVSDQVSKEKLLTAIAAFATVAIRGDLPKEVAPFLCSGRLVALYKNIANSSEEIPAQPEDLRPVAVGEVLRRIIGKILMRRIIHTVQERLPNQMGVGCRGQ